MATYLLTWNPNLWSWDELRLMADSAAERGGVRDRWNCGNTKSIKVDDRVFLLRQGKEPRGIIARGKVVSAPYEYEHWDSNRSGMALYIDVVWDSLQNPDIDPILRRDRLARTPYSTVHWDTQTSGISIPDSVAYVLDEEWTTLVEGESTYLSERSETARVLREGAARAVTLNVYERNYEARKQCLAHYGTSCVICGFDFGKVYGIAIEKYIHVHHVRSIAELGAEYVVDPIADLRPVCPNCHAVLHHKSGPYSIDDVRSMLGSD